MDGICTAHIYRYLSNRFLMDHIEEFQSPNFHGVAQKCFLVLLLISRGGAGDSRARIADERRADGFVRDVCGTVCVAEYSGFFDSAGDDGWAVGAGGWIRSRILSRE